MNQLSGRRFGGVDLPGVYSPVLIVAMTDESTHVFKALISAIKAENVEEVRRLAAQESFDVNAVDEVFPSAVHS